MAGVHEKPLGGRIFNFQVFFSGGIVGVATSIRSAQARHRSVEILSCCLLSVSVSKTLI